jgi:hypothetical protein
MMTRLITNHCHPRSLEKVAISLDLDRPCLRLVPFLLPLLLAPRIKSLAAQLFLGPVLLDA